VTERNNQKREGMGHLACNLDQPTKEKADTLKPAASTSRDTHGVSEEVGIVTFAKKHVQIHVRKTGKSQRKHSGAIVCQRIVWRGKNARGGA